MARTKIVVTDYIELDLDWEAEQLAGRPDVVFECHQLKLAPKEELIARIADADIIGVNMALFDEQVIAGCRKCKLILRHGIGYDNVDVAACTRNGIRLAYYPDYCATEVAEQAVALIFACARKLFVGRRILQESSERQQWDFSTLGDLHRLFGATLGIVGCGRIGGRVARMMSAVGMRIMVCDPGLDDRQRGALGIAESYDLEAVLREADVVTLHTPLNAQTRHMIDEPQLRLMKPTAYLVNTSRGGVINTPALERALREGWIAGAGIDVYEAEPPPADQELLRLPNATLSAHLGWCSVEAGWRIRQSILADIEACLRGDPPANTVNPEVGDVLGGKVYREV